MSSNKSITSEELNELINTAITLLPNDFDKAVQLLHPYFPVNGPVTVDYGIYTMRYALIFGISILKSKEKSLAAIINKLFEDCKSNYPNEYQKMLAWITQEMPQAVEQLKRARLNLLMDFALARSLAKLNTFSATEVQSVIASLQFPHPRSHLLANAYKDMYEVTYFFELLANLLQISIGKPFSSSPFKGKTIKGVPVTDRDGRLIKGRAINWLVQESSQELGVIIQSSYSNKIRNLLGGHNDYSFNELTGTYESKDGKLKYPYSEVLSYYSALELLVTALRLDGIIRPYEESDMPGEIWQVGFMNWSMKEPSEKILIMQNWSNFWRRPKGYSPKIISFYRVPMKREGKYVALGFDKKYFFPYDLRVVANEDTTQLMKGLLGRKTIEVTIVGLAPKVEPFTKISSQTYELEGKEFLIVGAKKATMEIDASALETLVNYLEH
ncbi:hypothetical protein KJZ67_00020 [Patescibacteria group bacterium]|nr:hypothetical protein [Patescibacteria group bacterium]